MADSAPVLAIDLGSPAASVALARGGELLAESSAPRDEESEPLARIEQLLAGAGVALGELGGVVAVRGPGSFTGTRIACATALGLAQALGLPATGASSLEALALAAPAGSGTVLAVVDALRGEWFAQRWERGGGFDAVPLEEAAVVGAADPRMLDGVGMIVGTGAWPRAADAGSPLLRRFEAPCLARGVACAASLGRWRWEIALLSHPLYLRMPAVTVAK